MKNTPLFLRRSGAFVIDLAAVYVTGRIAEFNHGELLAAWMAYETFSIHWKGFSLGKYCLRLRVAMVSGKRVPLRQAFLRAVGKLFSTALLLAGDWWMLRDKKGRTWHDQWVGTVVKNVK